MLAGGFIGPKLTELITLDQYKFVFGWILLVLAALMFWQTTPGYYEQEQEGTGHHVGIQETGGSCGKSQIRMPFRILFNHMRSSSRI